MDNDLGTPRGGRRRREGIRQGDPGFVFPDGSVPPIVSAATSAESYLFDLMRPARTRMNQGTLERNAATSMNGVLGVYGPHTELARDVRV